MPFRTLDGIDLAGKRVLVRADLNVPMHDGEISDTTRLERLVPTLHELMDGGAKVIVCSHFERPKGKRVPSMSLRPVADALGVVLARPVAFTGDCIGPEAEAAVAGLAAGDVLVLENTRFHAGEEANDPEMAKQLAGLADIYVNDAFSAAHRAHASTEGVARLLPSYAGRLMQQELEALDSALGNPVRPVCAVVGGSKVSTKLELLGNLVGKVDMLVIGGAMANTFLAAQGAEVGRSLQEAEMHDTARDILQRASAAGCEIVLPTDAVVAREFKAHAATEIVSARAIPAGRDDARCGAGLGAGVVRAAAGAEDGRVERPARRLRDAALRPRHQRAGACRRRRHRRWHAPQRGRWRRHRVRTQGRRRGRADDLRQQCRRGILGVAGGQDAAGRGGAERLRGLFRARHVVAASGGNDG